MIPISEVIEACAQEVDHILKPGGGTYGDAIRARAAKYEWCIVAEGPAAWMREGWGPDCGPYIELYTADEMGLRDTTGWTPLYRAKETK